MEVNGKVSAWLEIDSGTIQGSILGPILFALFTSPLCDIIEKLIAYADDNYIISIGDTLAASIYTSEDKTLAMITWLTKSGLYKCNQDRVLRFS